MVVRTFPVMQLPWLPEWWLMKNHGAGLAFLWHTWSPPETAPTLDAYTARVYANFAVPQVLSSALLYYRHLIPAMAGRWLSTALWGVSSQTQVPALAWSHGHPLAPKLQVE